MHELNDEHVRILQAAADGHLSVNGQGRYVIENPAAPVQVKRPARREREQLQQWGLLGWKFIPDPGPRPKYGIPRGQTVVAITEGGKGALDGHKGEGA